MWPSLPKRFDIPALDSERSFHMVATQFCILLSNNSLNRLSFTELLPGCNKSAWPKHAYYHYTCPSERNAPMHVPIYLWTRKLPPCPVACARAYACVSLCVHASARSDTFFGTNRQRRPHQQRR